MRRKTNMTLLLCGILALASVCAMYFVLLEDGSIPFSKDYATTSPLTQQRESLHHSSDKIHGGHFPVDFEGISVSAPQRRTVSWSLVEARTSTAGAPCTICGNLGVDLMPGKIMFPEQNVGNELSPEWNCSKLEELVMKRPVGKCQIDPIYQAMCCDQSGLPPPYECEQRIRANLFKGAYDAAVAPLDKDTRMLEVETFIELQYLKYVDVTTSFIEIVVEIFQSWKDPRLAWNVSATNCVTNIDARVSHDPEKTDIWAP